MLYLSLLILLTIAPALLIKRRFSNKFIQRNDELKRLTQEHENKFEQNLQLKKQNTELEAKVRETIALYEITKDITKTLREDKIFTIFKDNIARYIEVEDCRYLKDEAELWRYKNYTVLPIKIQDKPIGYLAATGIEKEGKEKFLILASQFVSGIKRAVLYQRVQELTITDGLTQVFNRRHFLDRCNEELERSKKLRYCFSFLIVDLDYFKKYNDHYGHLVGDVILREVTKEIKENIRQVDFMGRYGGEELSIVLTETDKEKAGFAAERIRQAIESKSIRAYDEDLKITVSIGLATFPDDSPDIQGLIERGDEALYIAKEAGRNQVRVFNPTK
ncbi:MAG: GGDEF domain-containing protein [Candidatus Omnitrophica bacterium]|nr:GGDEF domain-containing protein [Candidatus Omnitrophota bacterium]